MDHVMLVGGWYIEDREYKVSARRVMKIIESASDPRSEYFQVMRRENIPADELMGRRMEIGVIAVLAQLGAKRNWHRIMREWVYADEPETELGRAGVGVLRVARRARARDRAVPRPRRFRAASPAGLAGAVAGTRTPRIAITRPTSGDRGDDPQAELDAADERVLDHVEDLVGDRACRTG